MLRESKRAVWVKRVAAFERSGLSRQVWCSSHGVSVASLDAWRYRPRREGSGGLVPVVVAEARQAPAASIVSDAYARARRRPRDYANSPPDGFRNQAQPTRRMFQ